MGELAQHAGMIGKQAYPHSMEARCNLEMAAHAGREAAMDGALPRPAGQHGNAHRAERRRYMAAYTVMCRALHDAPRVSPAY